jgi:hypothetical protein
VSKNLNTLFPFYESLTEQNKNEEYVYDDCPFVALTNKLPTFIVRRLELPDLTTVTLQIYDSNDNLIQTLTAATYLGLQPAGDYDYLYYNDTLLATPLSLGLTYYIKIYTGIETLYSELFNVKSDLSSYIKLTYYNGTDLNTVLAGFAQALYVNAVLKTPEYPRIDDAIEKNGINIYKSQILQKQNVITVLAAPEYIVDSLMTLPMMDNVSVTVQNGDTIEIQQVEVPDPEWNDVDRGATAKLRIELIEYTIIKRLNFTEMGCPATSGSDIRNGVASLTAGVQATITFSSSLASGYTPNGKAQDALGNTVLFTIADITTAGFKVTANANCTFYWSAVKE